MGQENPESRLIGVRRRLAGLQFNDSRSLFYRTTNTTASSSPASSSQRRRTQAANRRRATLRRTDRRRAHRPVDGCGAPRRTRCSQEGERRLGQGGHHASSARCSRVRRRPGPAHHRVRPGRCGRPTANGSRRGAGPSRRCESHRQLSHRHPAASRPAKSAPGAALSRARGSGGQAHCVAEYRSASGRLRSSLWQMRAAQDVVNKTLTRVWCGSIRR